MKNIVLFVLSASAILCLTMAAVGQESADEPTTLGVRVEAATKTDIEYIIKKLDETNEKVDKMDGKIDALDEKFTKKFDNQDVKINSVAKDASYILGQLNALKWGVGIILSILVIVITAYSVWIAYKKFKKTESVPAEPAPPNESSAQAQETRPFKVVREKPPTATQRHNEQAPPKPSAPPKNRPHSAVKKKSKRYTDSEKPPKK